MEREAYDEMRAIEDHHWWFLGKRRMLRPHLRSALTEPGAIVVEIGCGTGANLALLERDFARARPLGLDRDPHALELCRGRALGAGLVLADGSRLPFRARSVDCLVALDFIEHVDDDRALIREFARVLRAGGVLIASVPAYPALWSKHDEFLHHKRRYRTGELEAKFVEAGFNIRRQNGFNFLLLPLIALVRTIRRKSASAPSTDFFELPRPVNAALAGLFVLEDWLVRAVGVPFGTSFFVRAEKP
jgi:SAM-dependent methyltransferase